MPNHEQLSEIIINYLEQNRDFLKLPKDVVLGPESRLFGQEGLIDSIGLVHLIVFLEKKLVTMELPKVSLVSSKAMSAKASPFKDIGTLSVFIAEKLKA